MYLAILGYATIIIMMFLLLKNKVTPIVAFCFLPVIAGLLSGCDIMTLIGYVGEGVQKAANTARMTLFATMYFCLMTEKGLFDPAIKALSKRVGNNISLIFVSASIIAAISHLDSGMTSTFLVTIPAMLPLFKHFHCRTEWLFLIIAQQVAIISQFPHGGGMVRISALTGLEPAAMFQQMLPLIVIIFAYNIVTAYWYGKLETKRLKAEGIYGQWETLATDTNGEEEKKNPTWKTTVNLLITLGVLGSLFISGVPAYMPFMFGLAFAMLFNYETPKEQVAALKRNAESVYPIAAIMLTSGVLVGVLNGTGMMTEMANVIIYIIPEALSGIFHWIIAIISIPLGMALGADGYFYGLTNLFTTVGEAYGFSVFNIAVIEMLVRDCFCMLTPVSAVTHLAAGMLGFDFPHMIKFAVKWLCLLFAVELFFCVVLGLIPLIML